MDLEHLNKTQIILLTLLVSFVTSIATGIVTVSLLAQAPPAVTQTINRVVERTIEHAVPTPSGTTSVKETTVVVKEDDLITDSISKNAKSILRIQKPTLLESGETALRTAGLAVVVNKGGLIATDSSVLAEDTTYTAVLSDGTTFPVKIAAWSSSSPIALATLTLDEKTKGYVFTPVTLGDPSAMKLGQTVLALSGIARASVSAGIVSTLVTADPVSATSTPAVTYVGTSVDGSALLPGSPLINIFGEVVGITTSDSRRRDTSVFTPSAAIAAQVAALTKSADALAPAAQTAAAANSN